MKKFIAVFDGSKMSESTLKYAVWLTKSVDAYLVGVFSDEFISHSYRLYEAMTTNKDYEKVINELIKGDAKKEKTLLMNLGQCVKKQASAFLFVKMKTSLSRR